MPEMTFTVEWPDGSFQECYSPSLVMHDHLSTDESYPVKEFVRRVATALDEASRRVREKYGFACTSAAAQKQEIQARAQQFSSGHDSPEAIEGAGYVRILAMVPPLPSANNQEVTP